ncbi:MAG: hypothetical protein WA840_06495 [Caulobacteraceae bacterium]
MALLAIPTFAFAQAGELQTQPGQFALKLSGFQNLDLSDATRHAGGGNSESEVEIGPQYRTSSGVVIAARAVLNLEAQTSLGGSGSAWSFTEPELSIFAIGPFGRVELGDRAGFPQSLVGFTPSEIAFTAAEFGPDSGSRLDPNGHLPTEFLPRALGDRINGVTYLGYAERFYDDRSPKLIYVSPRSRSGVYGAISYTPRTDVDGGGFMLADGARIPASRLDDTVNPGAFRNVVQAALVWNYRTEWLDLSTGATFSDASAVSDPPSPFSPNPSAVLRRSDSLSSGVSATLYDTWAFGLSGTYDGFSQQRTVSGDSGGTTSPYGVVTSLNYVNGPWVIGGYYQHAVGDNLAAESPGLGNISAGGSDFALHRDTLNIGELGASYLVDKNHDLLGAGHYTDIKLYASVYLYNFHGQGAPELDPSQNGSIFIAGARFSFF